MDRLDEIERDYEECDLDSKDIEWVIKTAKRYRETLQEIKSVSSMWDYRHSEDNTGYGDITKIAKAALKG